MVGPPNWADDSISGSKSKPRAKTKRRTSKPTKRMARIMGCEFVTKATEQSCPMCCGPVDEDGMTLAIATGTRSDETENTGSVPKGCQSGSGATAASPNPSSPSGISREDEG